MNPKFDISKVNVEYCDTSELWLGSMFSLTVTFNNISLTNKEFNVIWLFNSNTCLSYE